MEQVIERMRKGTFAWFLEDKGFVKTDTKDEWVIVKDGMKTIVRIEQEWVGR